MSAPVTNAALRGSLSPARNEGAIVPAMVINPKMQGENLPHEGRLVSAIVIDPELQCGNLPAIVMAPKLQGRNLPHEGNEIMPAMVVYPQSQGETGAQRRGRSCVGRFLGSLGEALTAGLRKSGKDEQLKESWASPSVCLPAQHVPPLTTQFTARTRNKRHGATAHRRQGRSLGQVHRHKILPEDVCHDDWRTDFQQKFHEAIEKQGGGVLSVKKLERMTWDSILENHARNRRQPDVQQRFHEATEKQGDRVLSVKNLERKVWDSIIESHARSR